MEKQFNPYYQGNVTVRRGGRRQYEVKVEQFGVASKHEELNGSFTTCIEALNYIQKTIENFPSVKVSIMVVDEEEQ